MSSSFIDGGTFTIHRVTILMDGDGFLDDRLIVDATGPDGERREHSVRDWHVSLINAHYEESWRFMGAKLLAIANKIERCDLIKGARRDHGYVQF